MINKIKYVLFVLATAAVLLSTVACVFTSD